MLLSFLTVDVSSIIFHCIISHCIIFHCIIFCVSDKIVDYLRKRDVETIRKRTGGYRKKNDDYVRIRRSESAYKVTMLLMLAYC